MKNLGKGFIVFSKALFASSILFVCKANRGLCLCVNYQKLNTILKKNCYPLSLINKILEYLSQARIFTKLDIQQTFYKIWIDSESENLATFWTCYKVYKYWVMLFGLINRSVPFQRYVNNLFLDYLNQFIIIFIDDILVYSQNKLEHQKHVIRVLNQLQETGLQADIRKCEFYVI